jgi:hypothetical protein
MRRRGPVNFGDVRCEYHVEGGDYNWEISEDEGQDVENSMELYTGTIPRPQIHHNTQIWTDMSHSLP